MADLTFQERYRADKRFKGYADGIHMEAVFVSAGIDPESLNDAYEAGVRPLTLEAYEEWMDAADEREREAEAAAKAAAEAEAEEARLAEEAAALAAAAEAEKAKEDEDEDEEEDEDEDEED